MKRVALDPGFVLHARAYRESSQILELFTETQGRVAVVARGARSARHRLQPFQLYRFTWSARDELGTLRAADASDGQPPLSGERMLAGLYMNELLMKMLTRNDPHEQLYHCYGRCIEGLRETSEKLSPLLRRFELELLQETGYGLDLTREADTGADIDPDADYEFHPAAGVRRVSQETDATVRGATLLALASGQWQTDRELGEARRVLRLAIRQQLGGTPLHTPELLRELQAIGRSSKASVS